MNLLPIARQSDIIVQNLDNELLIYNLKTNQAYSLNETSALIYQLCDGNRTIDQIVDEVNKQLKHKVNTDFVWYAIYHLQQNDLISETKPMKSGFEGISRREAVRKVGLATLAVLPFITMVTAPKAAAASSTCQIGDPCSNPSDCCFEQGIICPSNGSGVCVACRTELERCVANSDCCGGLTCRPNFSGNLCA